MSHKIKVYRDQSFHFFFSRFHIIELTKAVESWQESCNNRQEELESLRGDLSAARELSRTLEKARDDLRRQMTRGQVDHDSSRAIIESLQVEKTALFTQIQAEEEKVQKLERLVSHERTQKVHSEMSAQVR